MVFFNPTRPIIVRVEASYHEGLSAGLFQETEKGLQPVHFISRTMTKVEKKYGQTEKDALAVHWAKNRFTIYLLGAPRFKIITAHKPLIPLFNKSTIKLPPRTEKLVMGMQDVEVYQPGKDEADPLDFLSRHPLLETGTDSEQKVICQVISSERAVVLEHIQDETRKDAKLQKLAERISRGDWEQYRKDPDIAPFHTIRCELYSVNDLIFRLNQIVTAHTPSEKSRQSGSPLRAPWHDKDKTDATREILVSNIEYDSRASRWTMFRVSSDN